MNSNTHNNEHYIVVNFDESSDELVLSEVAERVRQSQLFAIFLRQHKGEFQSDDKVVIPCSKDDLASIYRTCQKILQRIDIPIGEAENLSRSIRDVQEAEKQFEEFARAAESIWHGNIEPEGLIEFAQIVEGECPGRKLYARQLLSAYHLAFSQHSCNFSVPGSGKTTIVLAAFAYLNVQTSEHRRVDHILVVAPLSAFKAWEDEFCSLFNRNPKVKRISGIVPIHERRAYLRGHTYAERNTELTLTSFQSFMGLEADFVDFLRSSNRRVMMVVDEAHYIKREDGEWATAVLNASPYAVSRVILTGTPVPNGYEDLNNLFKFIHPGRNIIGFPSGTLKAMSAGQLPQAVDQLKKRVRPFFTRIKKRDLGLAPISESRCLVPMCEEQSSIYEDIEQLIIPRIRERLDQHHSTLVKARLIRLRQAATNPSLLLRPLEADGYFQLDHKDVVSSIEHSIAHRVENFVATTQLRKLDKVKQLVDQIISSEGKVLVWSFFLGNLALLHRELTGHSEFIEVISGATPIDASDVEEERNLPSRERIVRQFIDTHQTSILIANPQAIGESISLHRATDSAIYFDRDFNAAKFIQSKDRIHRYDTNGGNPKKYYYLISNNTVEEVVDERLELKEERMTQLIDADDIPLFDVADSEDSREDIRAIIKAYEFRKTN